MDYVCADLISKGTTPIQLAEKIVRVFILEESEIIELFNSPRALVYLGLLGVCSPVYIALRRDLAEQYGGEEATFVQSANSGEHAITTCYKYLIGSRILVMLGQCGSLSKKTTAFQLIGELTKHLNDIGNQFAAFPVDELLKKVNHTWRDHLPRKFSDYSLEEQAYFESYFIEYRKTALSEQNIKDLVAL